MGATSLLVLSEQAQQAPRHYVVLSRLPATPMPHWHSNLRLLPRAPLIVCPITFVYACVIMYVCLCVSVCLCMCVCCPDCQDLELVHFTLLQGSLSLTTHHHYPHHHYLYLTGLLSTYQLACVCVLVSVVVLLYIPVLFST